MIVNWIVLKQLYSHKVKRCLVSCNCISIVLSLSKFHNCSPQGTCRACMFIIRDHIGDAIRADSYFRTQGRATNPHNSESSQIIFNWSSKQLQTNLIASSSVDSWESGSFSEPLLPPPLLQVRYFHPHQGLDPKLDQVLHSQLVTCTLWCYHRMARVQTEKSYL